MRRFIAYILMALSILLAVGVAATPVFSKLNAGREFTNSYEILYTIEKSADVDATESRVEEVAKEFRTRLENFNVEDYSVKVQEDQTSQKGNTDKKYAIEASFAAEQSEFEFISKYLAFSGGNFSLIGEKDEQFVKNVFDDSKAYITKLQDTVPYVIIPISDKTQVEQFLKTVDESDAPDSDNGDVPQNNRIDLPRMYAEEGESEEEKSKCLFSLRLG